MCSNDTYREKICSIDIGKKNFAFLIEEINTTDLIEFTRYNKLKNIKSTLLYNTDGSHTDKMKDIFSHLFCNGKVILYKNSDLTENCNKKCYFDYTILHNLTNLLDEFSDMWKECSTIIIEQQMSFGKKNNTMALKIAQHCWTYFSIKYPHLKLVDFPSYHKTQILGAPKNKKVSKNGKVSFIPMNKVERKKWAVEKALEILRLRKDGVNSTVLLLQKKKDDLADTLCQLQAYKFLEYIK